MDVTSFMLILTELPTASCYHVGASLARLYRKCNCPKQLIFLQQTQTWLFFLLMWSPDLWISVDGLHHKTFWLRNHLYSCFLLEPVCLPYTLFLFFIFSIHLTVLSTEYSRSRVKPPPSRTLKALALFCAGNESDSHTHNLLTPGRALEPFQEAGRRWVTRGDCVRKVTSENTDPRINEVEDISHSAIIRYFQYFR